jgi:hypothetical protein
VRRLAVLVRKPVARNEADFAPLFMRGRMTMPHGAHKQWNTKKKCQ